jgi:NADPH2:quinone reductase
MRAAIYRTAGDSGALELTEIPTPDPEPGEVRVKIACSGVNPTDWKSLRAAGPPVGDFAVPNQDGAGVIDAVGEGVDPARVGERVWLLMAARERRWGTAAQFSVVPARRAVALPDAASFELGASLGVPALTAWHCLTADGPLTGLKVLVSGGAGAVGHMAIQLARWAGAERVIATVSGPEKAALASAAGAHTVVNYREPGAAEQIRGAARGGVDRFVEVALDANLDLDLAVAARHAVITSYAATPETESTVPVRRLMSENLTLRFMLLYVLRPVELTAAIDAVSSAVADGALQTLPLHRFALEDIAAAHDAVASGAVGKVLVEPVWGPAAIGSQGRVSRRPMHGTPASADTPWPMGARPT